MNLVEIGNYFKIIQEYGSSTLFIGLFLYLYYQDQKRNAKQLENYIEYQKQTIETLVLIKDSIANNYISGEPLRLFVRTNWYKLTYFYKAELETYIIRNNISTNLCSIELELSEAIGREFIRLDELLRVVTNKEKGEKINNLLKDNMEQIHLEAMEELKKSCESAKHNTCLNYNELTRRIRANIDNQSTETIFKINDLIL